MLPTKETLKVEFKSERTRPQSDDEIVDNIVALANTQGGELYLGVEDDGTPTGVSKKHCNINGLAAFVFNKTVPQQTVRVELLHENGHPVVVIEVDNSQQIVSTSGGKTLQRRLKADGTPEVVPLFVAQFISRLSQQRNYDYSEQPAPGGEISNLDTECRDRLRSHIRETNVQDPLLALDDMEFDRALGLITEREGKEVPTIAGLLTIGSVESIKRCVPTASAVFQVMDGSTPKMNIGPFFLPLVDMFDRISNLMQPWNPEHEIMSGLVHVNIPDFDHQAFREAMVNAFCHRDYAQIGSVRFMVDGDGLTISNPGGFIEGVSEDNLLTASPRSRNPRLSEIMRTAGFAERTGRGVDKIYIGSLASGGTMPDYSRSTASEVNLFIRRAVPDEAFILMVTNEERRRGSELSVWALIVLSLLKEYRRLTVSQLCEFSRLERRRVVGAVESLVESGVVEVFGSGQSRSYILSSEVYKDANALPAYVRQNNISATRRMGLVIELAEKNGGSVTSSEVMELLGVSYISAYRLLKKMTGEGKLRHEGVGPSSRYVIS
ncbi:RNA-binding domain-containing protein [Bifidobacterium merycicum]|uniref:ATP-dependent DNA helicase n=1 Tax=Bifidobacterium merycicum TaxID=78345 RepID=A0A087BD26_9BIFI|nr:RNA-binding domain-containing protein [Bifidobacterium merycicum]KFI68926.1 ATP-dependent DNA helicase [Bifidobacterium merycicum]MEE0971106.1 putative DNA binding domain-containing protein [Bifidobacterium ruminantium]SHE73513.1 ATP-dependent DNA helicase RecG [Bifidobacterium merycicum DSM 6492]